MSARARTGDLAGAREAAATLAPFWEGAAARVKARALFAKALRAARLLDEPALAAMPLRPFRLETLTRSDAKALSALVGSYGERWAQELVTAWSAKRRFHYPKGEGTEEWVASLPKLCLALRDTGETGTTAATLLLRADWGWAKDSIEEGLELSLPSARERTLSELARPLAAMLEGAWVIGATDLSDEAIMVLRRGEELAGCAIAVLRATPTQRWSATGLDTLAAHCSATLSPRLSLAP